MQQKEQQRGEPYQIQYSRSNLSFGIDNTYNRHSINYISIIISKHPLLTELDGTHLCLGSTIPTPTTLPCILSETEREMTDVTC